MADVVVLSSLIALGALLAVFSVLEALTPHTETLEAIEWIGGFFVGVPLAILLARRLLAERWLERQALARATPIIVFCAGGGLCAARVHGSSSGAAVLWLSAGAAAAVLALALLPRRTVATEPDTMRKGRSATVLFTAGALLGLVPFVPAGALSLRSIVVSAGIAAIFILIVRGTEQALIARRTKYALLVIVPIVLALLVWDVSMPNTVDHNFFLGPANEVRHGRYVLVDTYSQYGVAVIYFLATTLQLLPFGYGSLVLAIGILTAVGAVVIFAVLYIATRSIVLAGLATFVASIAGPIATIERVTQYPSVGFLRFGIAWLLVLALVMAYRDERVAHRPLIAAYVLLGLASTWSVEAAFYSTGTFVVVALFAAASEERIGDALPLLRGAVIAIVLSIAALVVATVIGRGAIPNPVPYAEVLRLYSSRGFGTLPIPEWSLGYAICASYVVSFVALGVIVVHAKGSELARRSTIVPIAATTAFGALSFTYFLGRSHPNNLTHISAPFVVVVALWVMLAFRQWVDRRQGLAPAAVIVAVVVSSFVIVVQWTNLRVKATDSAIAAILSPIDGQPSLRRDLRTMTSNPRMAQGSELVERLVRDEVPPAVPLLVLVEPAVATEVLMRLDRSNVLPISHATQDGLVATRRDAIVADVADVPCNTLVVTQKFPFEPGFEGSDFGAELTQGVLAELHANFTFATVASIPGYTVDRLQCPS